MLPKLSALGDDRERGQESRAQSKPSRCCEMPAQRERVSERFNPDSGEDRSGTEEGERINHEFSDVHALGV